jgi:hypothetical protein
VTFKDEIIQPALIVLRPDRSVDIYHRSVVLVVPVSDHNHSRSLHPLHHQSLSHGRLMITKMPSIRLIKEQCRMKGFRLIIHTKQSKSVSTERTRRSLMEVTTYIQCRESITMTRLLPPSLELFHEQNLSRHHIQAVSRNLSRYSVKVDFSRCILKNTAIIPVVKV